MRMRVSSHPPQRPFFFLKRKMKTKTENKMSQQDDPKTDEADTQGQNQHMDPNDMDYPTP